MYDILMWVCSCKLCLIMNSVRAYYENCELAIEIPLTVNKRDFVVLLNSLA